MADSIHVGVIAPPWLTVPPRAYGGTELMVDALCTALDEAGHEVTLFTVADSTCPVERRWLFDRVDPDRMGAAVEEFRHAIAAHEALVDVDIIHDHTIAGPFLGPKYDVAPLVTTIHGPFDANLSDLYAHIAQDVPVVAISHDQARRAPEDVPIAAVIHHGLDLARYPYVATSNEHLLFLGRMSPDKGVETAIRVARRTGQRLLIAAKMREPGEISYFRNYVEPHLGSDIEFVGEADFAAKVELLGSASALINPIRWPEPFGLVMAEALACGTPVVGGTLGAAREIVDHGRTGFLADDDDGLVAGVRRIAHIDRARCRRTVEQRFSKERMAADYLDLYREIIEHRRPNGTRAA